MIEQKIKKLRELINYHIYKYYIEQEPEISDNDFDQLLIQLQNLEDQYPEFDSPDSPTHKVNGGLENKFTEIYHKIPMLSLGKCMTFEEFETWFKKMVGQNVKRFTFEVKLDGLACSLTYNNGILTQGLTRGDGEKGEDITATILTIPSIPKKIDCTDFMEVRGEVILLKSSLDAINKAKEAKGEKKYENVRNAASGILRTKNPSKEMGQYLRFGAYMLAQSNSNNKVYSENMDFLKDLGFTPARDMVQKLEIDVSTFVDIKSVLDTIQQYFKNIEELRRGLDFDIDGIVIKADLYEDQERLGCKTNIPNWATAFKFESERKMTQIIGCEHLLGAKGNITPRAQLVPVRIGGTTVTKPTLHNYDEIKRLGVKIGDYVWIERRGDVIPKITGVVFEMRNGTETDIEFPTHCPECGAELKWRGGIPRCDNRDCAGGQAFKIQNYIKALEIEEFGPSLIEKLFDAGKISTVPDIYDLKVEDISNLDRMGEKTAKKVIANIEKSKKAPLSKVIAGLTIKNIGESTSKIVAELSGTLHGFKTANIRSDINFILTSGIGEVAGNNLYNWLNESKQTDMLQRLIDYGVGMDISNNKVVVSSNKLNSAKFGFTGELPNYKRKQAEKLIIDNGGEVFGIKKGMDYLLVGPDGKQEKIDKAKKYGTKIINEKEFLDMLK
jgi:DNA ligase (NAD+)